MAKTTVLSSLLEESHTQETKNNLKKIRDQMQSYRKIGEIELFGETLKKLEISEEKFYEAISCATKTPIVLLRRSSNEVDIKNYNRELLDVWEGNHDIQYILDPYNAIKYLFGYCFKSEYGMIQLMKDAVEECKDGNHSVKERIKKVSNVFINSSLISAQEAADECLGIHSSESYKDKKSKCVIELERLRSEAKLSISFYDFDCEKGKSVIYHNINSYQKHKSDVLTDCGYRKAHVVILAEANIEKINSLEILPTFDLLYLLTEDKVVKKKSRGLIIFAKPSSEVRNISPSHMIEGKLEGSDKSWQLDLRTFELDNHYFIVGYKSPRTPNEVFKNQLNQHNENAPKNLSITIMGDFNINVKKPNNLFSITMTNFVNQLNITTSTTDANTQIDVVFSTSIDGFGGTWSSYFSDHSAIFYQTQKDFDKN